MATWTDETKNTSSWDDGTKHGAGASWDIKSFLLQENLFFLLLETGKKIVLNWGNTKNEAVWANINKN